MDILNEKIEGLVTKAEKSGMPYGILKKVYDRGMAAWKTGHRPGTTPQQWAFARVNSFVTKSSGTWGKADADLAKQVRGEQVENRTKSAKDILGQIREARYEIGFERGEVDMVISDRPGELAMIVQDELDSERIRAKVKSTGDEFTLEFNTNIPQRKMLKILDDKFGYTAFAEQNEKEEVKEENCPKCDDDPCKCENIQEQNSLTASDKSKLVKHFDKLAKDYSLSPENQDAYKAVSDYIKMKTKRVDFDDVMKKTSAMHKQDIEIEMSRIIGKSKTKKVIESKEENIQESGHTDVASMKTQVQIAKDALEKMNMELGKLGDEEDLPTWWTNKVATAVGKLDGMADYINAKSQQGDNMNEAPRQLKDPKKETMVMKVKDAGSIMVIDKKDLQKYTSKGYIQVESNEEDLDEGKYTLPITHVIVDTRTNKVTHAASSDKSLKLDVGRKSHLKIVKLKKPTTQKKTGYLLGEPLKAWGEEVELDEKEINYDGKGPIKMSKKEYASVNKFQKSMIRGKPYVMALNTKNQSTNLVPVIFEEVDDNSMMARATRLISQTAIKEKLDPADVDMKATDLDRKAADKNIFIQLKRAQDMKGKTDVEFLDKKKQKVDIKIINKALDMFDKMKPNDKLKMQLAIGKSYRDLLKVVQRGKV